MKVLPEMTRRDFVRLGVYCEKPMSHSLEGGFAMVEAESFTLPRGYDDTAVHIANFFNAVVTRKHVVEDEVFDNSAAVGCHLANHSYFHRTPATWDAAKKTIKV
jgi:hypothetical protein